VCEPYTRWNAQRSGKSLRQKGSGGPVKLAEALVHTTPRLVTKPAHERGEGRAVRVLIPRGRDAQLSPKVSVALQERDRNIRSIRELGRRDWHTRSGYSTRSLVENTMYRYKTIIGRSMRSRTFDGQQVEVQLASRILNTMTLLRMPDSYRVA